MKKRHFSLIASVLLLSGCAGMNSEFTCGATAKDQCMTMDEANNKARASSESAVKTAVLPPLASLAPVSSPLPVVPVTAVSRTTPVASLSRSLVTPIVPAVTTAPTTASTSSSRNPFTGRSRAIAPITDSAPVSMARTVPVSPAPVRLAHSTPVSGWADIGMTPPMRQSATVARLWIAAWVDEGQVYHQPSVVSFEAKAAHWSVQDGAR